MLLLGSLLAMLVLGGLYLKFRIAEYFVLRKFDRTMDDYAQWLLANNYSPEEIEREIERQYAKTDRLRRVR